MEKFVKVKIDISSKDAKKNEQTSFFVKDVIKKLKEFKKIPVKIVEEDADISINYVENAKKLEEILKETRQSYIFILKNISHIHFRAFLKSSVDVAGVFKLDSLVKDYEEKGRFQKCLKDLLRRYTLSFSNEESDFLTKNINWKVETKDIEYNKNKMVSMFFDETMVDFSHKIKSIIKNYEQEVYFLKGKKRSYKEVLQRLRELRDKKNFKNVEKEINEELNVRIPAILITGESGTGKTLTAQYIADELTDSKIVRIPVVNLSKDLLDSELFGSVKGAFTDAEERAGKIETNMGSTLFIDEIGDVSIEVQSKLLSYLDNMKIQRVGNDSSPLVRPTLVVAATNKNLIHEIEIGKFRLDLYNRFRYQIHIPSLEERKFDIRFLISFILQDPSINPYDDAKRTERWVDKISIQAISYLEKQKFPGNYRQLEVILAKAVQNAYFERRNIILIRDLI